VNASAPPARLELPGAFNVATCDATGIALAHGLGSRTMPIVNTAVAGAFAAATGLVALRSVLRAIPDVVPVETSANQSAAEEAFGRTQVRLAAGPALATPEEGVMT
ncbi:MAG TPA: hypothetical protein VM364_09130, partial [Vicinamibacterales bacterium]|nr:hypothetical protein [Vicinamibacterales bacterium]